MKQELPLSPVVGRLKGEVIELICVMKKNHIRLKRQTFITLNSEKNALRGSS